MSELSKARIPDAPAIQRLPLLQLILVGLQHVLLMYGGAIAGAADHRTGRWPEVVKKSPF